MKVELWVRYRHDDYIVKTIEVPEQTVQSFATRVAEDYGVLLDVGFIPWHCINHIRELKG